MSTIAPAKQKLKLVHIPVILMVFTGMLMIGIGDFIAAGFNPRILLSADFVNNIITTNAGILCLIVAIILLKIDHFIDNDSVYKITEQRLINFRSDITYSEPMMDLYCADENSLSKKSAYLKAMTERYTALKPSAKDLEIYRGSSEEDKIKNRYCRREKRLSYLMSEEYIINNLSKLSVKYNTITPALIFSGVPTNSQTTNYITLHKTLKVFRDMLPKFLLGFAITALMAALQFDLKEGINVSVIIKTATKIFTIASQIYYAISYSNKFNQEVTLKDLQFRDGKISGFKLWLANKTKGALQA